MRDTFLDGRFRIRDQVGMGGMGEVWSALDERMRREVAITFVHAHLGASDVEARIRFQREALLAARLGHRNIVTVHDWGETWIGTRPALYLVMELLDGASLRQRLKEATPHWCACSPSGPPTARPTPRSCATR